MASNLEGEFVLFVCYQGKVCLDQVQNTLGYFQVLVFWGDGVASQGQLSCARAVEVRSF